jgi:hypothetical protein
MRLEGIGYRDRDHPVERNSVVALRRFAQPSGSRIGRASREINVSGCPVGYECRQRNAVRSTPLYTPETIFSDRDPDAISADQ